MTRTWIVAFDYSDYSRQALDYAIAQLTGLGGGRLLVVHVLAPRIGDNIASGSSSDPELSRLTVGDALADLVAEVTRSSAPTEVELVPRIHIGHPAELLAQLATSEQAEHIVCGSHGRQGLAHFFVGSVAERIVQRARCTVTIVKSPRVSA